MDKIWNTDNWETPEWLANQVAEIAWTRRPLRINRIIEPFAGNGNIVVALRKEFGVKIWANEIDTDRFKNGSEFSDVTWTNADFLRLGDGRLNAHDLIVTNPPFSLTSDAIEYIFSRNNTVGAAMLLLPIDFFCSKGRNARLKQFNKCFIDEIIPIVGCVAYIKEGEECKNRQIYDALYILKPGHFSTGMSFIYQESQR